MIASAYQASSAFLDATDGDRRNDIAAAVPSVQQHERPQARQSLTPSSATPPPPPF